MKKQLWVRQDATNDNGVKLWFREATSAEIAEAAGVEELLEKINGFDRLVTNLKQEVHDGLSLDAELRYEISKLHKQLAAVTKQRDGLLEAVDNILIPPEHDSSGYLGQAADVIQEWANGEELLWKALYQNEDNLVGVVASIKAAIAACGEAAE